MLEMEVICKEVTNVLKFFLSSQMGNKSHKFNDQPLLSPLKRIPLGIRWKRWMEWVASFASDYTFTRGMSLL